MFLGSLNGNNLGQLAMPGYIIGGEFVTLKLRKPLSEPHESYVVYSPSSMKKGSGYNYMV